jgi:hypothetical protein
MALNEVLYSRLVQKFGKDNVQIVRVGVPYNPKWTADPITGRLHREFDNDGEAYRLNCPYCGDKKGRLYVNHYWMQWDEDVCRHVDDMIGCFNQEKCFHKFPENRSRFFQYLFGGVNPSDINMVISEPAGPVKVIEPSPPGKIIRLTDLNQSQPICYYLRNRKYDVEWLDKYWSVGYVASVDKGHSPDCLNRIYIPMFYRQQLVGYQCRFIGDREWTADCPKVRTMPHMKRGKYLYNLDIASRSRVMVLVEGPTSNWAVGFRGTGLWGNSISAQQVNLVNEYWGEDCLVVVMLDGSAMKEAAKVTIKLQANCRAKVIQTRLNVADDPGSLGEANSWQIIEETCKRSGVNLHDYLRGENEPVVTDAYAADA